VDRVAGATGRSISRVSVERPLWRALTAFRVLSLCYVVARYADDAGHDSLHPAAGWAYLGVLAAWTFATVRQVSSARRCTLPFLLADLAFGLTGVLLTMWVDRPAAILAGAVTLPGIWTAGSVLAYAIKGGWRWAAPASAVVGLSNIVESGRIAEGNVHSIVLLFFVSTGIGYVVEVARGSERALTRALQIEAATRERERLARDIHDGVLQVLAMVMRRGNEIGGEAAELGRLAGEQEVALRALMLGRELPQPTEDASADGASPAAGGDLAGAGRDADGTAPRDLAAALAGYAGPRVTLSAPAEPVLLPAHAVAEVAAAVSAALDNVARHAGPEAHAWILVEEEPDAVLVTVRDDGPGIPEGRLEAAGREGRLGVAQSIRGRLRDLGGTADVVSVPGQGVEVELRLPRDPVRR
jgi:signal transduction histidine kinase